MNLHSGVLGSTPVGDITRTGTECLPGEILVMTCNSSKLLFYEKALFNGYVICVHSCGYKMTSRR